jgi:hypothetical protein
MGREISDLLVASISNQQHQPQNHKPNKQSLSVSGRVAAVARKVRRLVTYSSKDFHCESTELILCIRCNHLSFQLSCTQDLLMKSWVDLVGHVFSEKLIDLIDRRLSKEERESLRRRRLTFQSPMPETTLSTETR